MYKLTNEGLSFVSDTWNAGYSIRDLSAEHQDKLKELADATRTLRLLKSNLFGRVRTSQIEAHHAGVEMNPRIPEIMNQITTGDIGRNYSQINTLLRERFGRTFRELADAA